MTDNKANIPSPNIPMLQASGLLHPTWWRFFQSIYNRTGGAGGEIPELPDVVIKGEAPAVDNSAVIGALFQKVAYLEQQLNSVILGGGNSPSITTVNNLTEGAINVYKPVPFAEASVIVQPKNNELGMVQVFVE